MFRRKNIHELEAEPGWKRFLRSAAHPMLLFGLLGIAVAVVPRASDFIDQLKRDRVMRATIAAEEDGDHTTALQKAHGGYLRWSDDPEFLKKFAKLLRVQSPYSAAPIWHKLRAISPDEALPAEAYADMAFMLHTNSQEGLGPMLAEGLELYPDSSDLRALQADVLEMTGDIEGAAREWGLAREHGNGDPELHLQHLGFVARTGTPEERKTACESLLPLMDSPDSSESRDAIQYIARSDLPNWDEELLNKAFALKDIGIAELGVILKPIALRMQRAEQQNTLELPSLFHNGLTSRALINRVIEFDREKSPEETPTIDLVRWLTSTKASTIIIDLISALPEEKRTPFTGDYLVALLSENRMDEAREFYQTQKLGMTESQRSLFDLVTSETQPRADEVRATWRWSQVDNNQYALIALTHLARTIGDDKLAAEILDSVGGSFAVQKEKIAAQRKLEEHLRTSPPEDILCFLDSVMNYGNWVTDLGSTNGISVITASVAGRRDADPIEILSAELEGYPYADQIYIVHGPNGIAPTDRRSASRQVRDCVNNIAKAIALAKNKTSAHRITIVAPGGVRFGLNSKDFNMLEELETAYRVLAETEGVSMIQLSELVESSDLRDGHIADRQGSKTIERKFRERLLSDPAPTP